MSLTSKAQVRVQLFTHLSDEQYQLLMRQPITDTQENLIFFRLIGGDNSFTECVETTLATPYANIIPVFCFPTHKYHFMHSFISECETLNKKKQLQIPLLSEHIYASEFTVSLCGNKYKTETYLVEKLPEKMDPRDYLSELASQWRVYCEYLKENKDATKLLPEYLNQHIEQQPESMQINSF